MTLKPWFWVEKRTRYLNINRAAKNKLVLTYAWYNRAQIHAPTALDWKDITILLISFSETAWKWNFSDSGVFWSKTIGEVTFGRSWVTARDAGASASLAPTVEKNSLNSSAMVFTSLEYTACVVSFRGIQFLMTFHLEQFLWQEISCDWTCSFSASRRRTLTSLRFAR